MAVNDTYVTYSCVRALLLLFNIAFWFCGLAIVWAGIWLHTDMQTFFKMSTEYSTSAPLVLITIGTIIIFISTLACTCIVKVQQTMLVIYGAFLIMVLFAVIVLSAYIYTYKDQLINGMSTGINNEIRHYNIPPTKQSKLIDFVQEKLQCCGSESYLDWTKSPNETVPTSCCTKPLYNCNQEDPKTLFKIGCVAKLQELVDSNLTLIGATASAIALFPLFGTMLTFCLAATSRKNGYEPIL